MRYKHISQKPHCCVPACMQMILRRRGLPLLSQVKIAFDLGAIFQQSRKQLLEELKKGKQLPTPQKAVRFQRIKKYSLAVFFRRRGYPLQAEYYCALRFRSIRDFRCFLERTLKTDSDLLVLFNYAKLFHRRGRWGHGCLIEAVRGEYVLLKDPDSRYKRARKILLRNLFLATKDDPKIGVWVISEKK